MDAESYGQRAPLQQHRRLNSLQRSGAELLLCRGTPSTGTLHAKALVADRYPAFLGSANLTEKSARNGEFCFRMRGASIFDIMHLLDKERAAQRCTSTC